MYRTHYFVFRQCNSPADLAAEEQRLLTAARSALAKAYAPYSHFRVGAAALLSNGAVVSGANFENAAYPMCLCAERATLAAAFSQYPEARIIALAVTASAEGKSINMPATPCGACRQVLLEAEQRFAHPLRLILQGEEGPIWVFERVGDLLPLAFDAELLPDI